MRGKYALGRFKMTSAPPNTQTPPPGANTAGNSTPNVTEAEFEQLLQRRAISNPDKWQAVHEVFIKQQTGQAQAQQANAGFTLDWYHASEALIIDPPETEYLQGLIKAGDLVGITSESGDGKTYLSIGIGVHVAAGLDFAGRPVTQCPVLYVDAESRKKRFKRRLRYIANGANVDLKTLPFEFVVSSGIDLANDEHLEKLGASIQAKKAGLVFIDTLVATTEGLNENDSKEMEPPLRKLTELATQNDCSIVLLHHKNKQGGIRGATAIKGAVDCMFMLGRNKATAILTLKAEKNRDGDSEEEFTYKANFINDMFGQLESVTFTEATPPKPNDPVLDYVLEYLFDNQEASMNDLIDNATGFTLLRKSVYGIRDSGYIERVNPGGRGVQAIFALTTKGRGYHVKNTP